MNLKAKHNQVPVPGDFGDEMAADRYVDQVMSRDREGLVQKHDMKRSKVRAAAFLAASTASVPEAVGASAWFSKLAFVKGLSVKGIVGVIGTVAATGGAVLTISLSGGDRNQLQDTSPSALPSPASAAEVSVDSLPSVQLEAVGSSEAEGVHILLEQSPNLKEGRSVSVETFDPISSAKELYGATLADTVLLKDEDVQNIVVQPEIQQKESLRVNVKVDPIQINKKER